MRAIFSELTRRFETVEATAPPRFLRSNFQRGVKSLPIRWRARGENA
jgi:cytochrome P450